LEGEFKTNTGQFHFKLDFKKEQTIIGQMETLQNAKYPCLSALPASQGLPNMSLPQPLTQP